MGILVSSPNLYYVGFSRSFNINVKAALHVSQVEKKTHSHIGIWIHLKDIAICVVEQYIYVFKVRYAIQSLWTFYYE